MRTGTVFVVVTCPRKHEIVVADNYPDGYIAVFCFSCSKIYNLKTISSTNKKVL